MLDRKHTPGPWEVLNQIEVFSALGSDSGDGIKAHSTDGWMIADCDGAVTFTEIGAVELGMDVRRANARLIAAAPELLEALEMVIADKAPSYHDCIDDGEPECAWCIARKAIAKAGGTQ